MIKAVIFDIDGTLIDSNGEHADSFAEIFKQYGKDVPSEELKCLIGMGADDILKKYLSEAEIEKFGEQIKEQRKKLFLEKYFPKLKTFPKLRPLFEKISGDGKQIALASSASEEELEKYKKLLNIDDLYEEETNADDAPKAKPEPDIFLAAFERLKNVEKSEILIVGDTPYDAEAAVKAEMKIIGVNSGGWTTEKLLESGCSKVYRDIEDILANYADIFNDEQMQY